MVLVKQNEHHSFSKIRTYRRKTHKIKALELFEKNILDTFEIGTFKGLSAIHQFLFEDLYDFDDINSIPLSISKRYQNSRILIKNIYIFRFHNVSILKQLFRIFCNIKKRYHDR